MDGASSFRSTEVATPFFEVATPFFEVLNVCVFAMEGSLMLAFARHRLYIILVHAEAGGASVVNMVKMMVKGIAQAPRAHET